MFFSYQKVPRSPTPCGGKIYSRSESETKRKAILCCERDLPISFLAESDSLFIACQGLTIHYKLSLHDLPPTISLSSSRLKLQSPLVKTKTHHHLYRSFSQKYYDTSLYDPLLDESATSPTLLSDGIPLLSLDDGNGDLGSSNYVNMGIGVEEKVELAVVLVHGFGGGVFSWRHVSSVLARQVGCAVVAFDRPGWGLTSRPRRKDWEDKRLPNPYMLDSQVILLLFLSWLNNCSASYHQCCKL